MQKTEVEEAIILLQQHGILEVLPPEKLPQINLEELRDILRRQTVYLLERDMERLVQAMYRIDVPEQRVKSALVSEDPAGQLADLILQRELMKVQTRRWYASKLRNESQS